MKITVSVLLILAVLALAGCTKPAAQPVGATQGAALPMNQTDLRNIAFSHAGVEGAEVYDIEEEWDKRADTTVYELDFEADGVEYEYHIDSYTGQILRHSSEGNPQGVHQQLTQEDVKRIVLADAGLTEEQVQGLRVELDPDDNDYDVEFYADGFEYEYEIDATDGTIRSKDKER